MELVRLSVEIMGGRGLNEILRDYGTTRGYANESEFTVVKVKQQGTLRVNLLI